MRGITSLRNGLVRISLFGIGCSICIDLVRAIVLIVALALGALETGPDLSANTNAIPNFYCLDFGANLDNMANNLVTYADG